MKKVKFPYKVFDHFVLLTPLLSFDFVRQLTAGRKVSNESLGQAYANQTIREAKK